MIRWLLDSGTVGVLASSTDGVANWKLGQLHVGESVNFEARQGSPHGPRFKLLDALVNADPVVKVLSLPLTGAGGKYLYTHLRPQARSATADFGEHESIALCAHHDPELIFVSLDKAATSLALTELGRLRVASPYDLWESLRNDGVLNHTQFVAVCRRTAARMQPQRVPPRMGLS